MIVTDQEDAVKALIHDEIDRGITKLWSEGGYSKQQKALLFTVVEQAEAVYLKELLQQQTDSFVIFLNASDIYWARIFNVTLKKAGSATPAFFNRQLHNTSASHRLNNVVNQ